MARPDIRARTRKVSTGPAITLNDPPNSDAPKAGPTTKIANNKHQKRRVKHAALVSRARASSTAAGRQSSGIRKRRRPTGRLAGTDAPGLNKLASALDEALAQPAATPTSAGGRAKTIQLKPTLSIKSKRGVQQKKEKINRLERERFSRNLAVMNAGAVGQTLGSQQPVTALEGSSRAERWAALRKHISSTVTTG